jgi:glycosyltransferase involved in cell wall biosynthesis
MTHSDLAHAIHPANKPARLRILYVTPRFYPDMGGIETHVYEVARRLVSRVNTVTVLTTDRTRQQEPESVVEGVQVIRVPAFPPNRDYYWAPRISSYIKPGDWDIVHVQGFHTLVPPLAMRAARQAGLPYLLTFHSGGHSSGLRNAIRPLQARIQRRLLAGAARLIGVSQFEADRFRKRLNLPEEQFVVINNGASLPPMPEGFQPPQTDTEIILSVGRLEKYKGHHRLIEAMPHVIAQRPTARLKILGLGSYQAALHKMVRDMRLEDVVEITHVPPSDRTGMARELLSAALVMLFSEYEAHPVAVMEAVAMNCSILVADTTGLSEMAQKKLAKAIPINSSPQQIAEAMVDQLAHPFRADTVELPTWDTCADQLYKLYTQVALCES